MSDTGYVVKPDTNATPDDPLTGERHWDEGLADPRARLAAAEALCGAALVALRGMAGSLSDYALEEAREAWGHTNVAVARDWRDKAAILLATDAAQAALVRRERELAVIAAADEFEVTNKTYRRIASQPGSGASLSREKQLALNMARDRFHQAIKHLRMAVAALKAAEGEGLPNA